MKILLDAGHGGRDPGARDNQGNYEREQMIKLVDKVEYYLIQKGHSVIKYPNNQDSYANRDLGQWAKNNNVDEVVEFHFDIGEKGSILIYPGTPDEVDKRLNDVVNNYFGSKGIQGRNDLYNVSTLAQTGVPYRLVEVYGGWDNSDIDKFNSQLDNLANDFANAIVGGNAPKPQQNQDCWAILPNVTEINTPLITGIFETGYLFKGRDTRNKRFVWVKQKDGKLNTFVKAKTSSWTPGCGQGNGSELGFVKYKKVDEFLGEDGKWYNVANEDIWLVSHVNNQDQFKIERVY